MEWKTKAVASQDVKHLHEQYGLDPLCSSIMVQARTDLSTQVKFLLESELTICTTRLFDDMEEL